MSILDKHPWPWTIARETKVVDGDRVDPGDVVDSNGHVVVFGNGNKPFSESKDGDNDLFTTDLAERLILAAPELLAALKEIRDSHARAFEGYPDAMDLNWDAWRAKADAIIDRIEKGEWSDVGCAHESRSGCSECELGGEGEE